MPRLLCRQMTSRRRPHQEAAASATKTSASKMESTALAGSSFGGEGGGGGGSTTATVVVLLCTMVTAMADDTLTPRTLVASSGCKVLRRCTRNAMTSYAACAPASACELGMTSVATT